MAINRQVNYDGFTPQNCETFNVATPYVHIWLVVFMVLMLKILLNIKFDNGVDLTNFRPLTSNDSDLLTEAVE
ncbi:hypothetical protein MVEG_01480 [Podila verticillata NRRL 6337]|nr:hypothetical protein MVEG_01480 [Podila verticillata NRRL 6337]